MSNNECFNTQHLLNLRFSQENAKRVEFNGPSDPINKTEIEPVRGTQIYEPFTDPDQNDSDALHKPVPNVSSEAIVSGEAQYVDDIPQMAGI